MTLIREPAVAGRFYPSDPGECRRAVESMRRGDPIPGTIAAIVPHAGWFYSGRTAALSIAAISQPPPETVVIFGAVHVFDPNLASLFPGGMWRTPLGELRVDEELARRVARHRPISVDPASHAREHSIEVELPLIRAYLGDVRILPIMVRPDPRASEIGRIVASEAAELGRRVCYLASTDLTHYGPNFGFEPAGPGEAGIRWAKEVNDRRLIRTVASLDAEAVVPEAAAHQNACGAGAVAATIAAARELSSVTFRELEHTTSAEVERRLGDRPRNSVGYHAGVLVVPPVARAGNVDGSPGCFT